MNYLVTGDTHGRVMDRINNIDSIYDPQDTALIILGDAGLNFYLNKTDKNEKQRVQDSGYTVYCLRGNHEERPENIPTMEEWEDSKIWGFVYREPQFPNIRYLRDGGTYIFGDYTALAIGGAYSVDKHYRLSKAAAQGRTWTGWFKDEQLTAEEMARIDAENDGKYMDFIFSHTCPFSWQPTDLFLNGLDQSTIDKTMELWLDKFKNTVSWHTWLFGHFHDDRLVRPGVEMFYRDISSLDDVYDRWISGNKPAWWMKKDPNFYTEV